LFLHARWLVNFYMWNTKIFPPQQFLKFLKIKLVYENSGNVELKDWQLFNFFNVLRSCLNLETQDTSSGYWWLGCSTFQVIQTQTTINQCM
jgi:hypothetical protein